MTSIICRYIALGITTLILLTSCNSKPSLQQYYVDSQEKPGFVTTTIPKSILGITSDKMSEEAKTAYNSIHKVNILYYPIDTQNKEVYTAERKQLSQIINQDNFKLLMSHKVDNVNLKFLYEGETDNIDEIIVYGSSDDLGLGVARILGDDMQLGAMIKMLNELKTLDIKPAGMKNILKDLGVKTDENGKPTEEAIEKILEENGISSDSLKIQ